LRHRLVPVLCAAATANDRVIEDIEGSGVIYVLTIADTTRVASFLRTQGTDAHAGNLTAWAVVPGS
jgi:superfamily II DNA helicase RecQ